MGVNPLGVAEAEAVPVLALRALYAWTAHVTDRCRDDRGTWGRVVVPFL